MNQIATKGDKGSPSPKGEGCGAGDSPKALWLAALRSGDYVQGKYKLNRDGKFCCLGVLWDVVSGEWAEREGVEVREHGLSPKVPSRHICDALAPYGLTPPIIGDLASMNDSGMTFGAIADYIEAKVTLLSSKETSNA